MVPFQDHYRTLGVHRDAEQAVIEAAYRALVRRYHPDVNAGSASSVERLKQINAAYSALSDPVKRRVYDREWDTVNAPTSSSQTRQSAGPRPSPPPAPKPQSPPPPPTPSPTGEIGGRDKRSQLIRIAKWVAGLLVAYAILTSLTSPRAATTRPQLPHPTSTVSLRLTATATHEVIGSGGTLADYFGPTTGNQNTEGQKSDWNSTQILGPYSDIESHDDDLTTAQLGEDGLTITIKAPGGLDGYLFDSMPSEGRDFTYKVDIGSTVGWGEVTVILQAVGGDPEWTFAIDPHSQQWSLYRTSTTTSQLFYWVEPRSYATISSGPLTTLQVAVTNNIPMLWINGKDVVSPTRIAMPEMPDNIVVGMGAGINPESMSGHGDRFSVTFTKTALWEL